MAHNAIITGASRGIGAALAREFGKNGYNLALCCSNSKEELERLATELHTQYGIQVLPMVGDIGDYSFATSFVQSALDEFETIDVLINNAGISHIGLLADMEIEEWNRIVSVNLTASFSTCKQVIPAMVSRRRGKIINISSVWGNVGASCEVAYSACKGGINSFTRALGKELAPSNIQVNAIACGVIDTAMNACFDDEARAALTEEIPSCRFGKAEEVAHLAMQIATGNEYLTGQVITLDGGWM